MKKITFEERYIQVLKKALKIEEEKKPSKKKKSKKKEEVKEAVEILDLNELNK